MNAFLENVADSQTIGKGFAIPLTVVLVAIVGGAYHLENEYINNSIAVVGRIERLRVVPKKRIISVRVEADGQPDAARSHEMVIEFWDSRKVGEPVKIRRRTADPDDVKIDEFIYLHNTSIRIAAGMVLFSFALVGALWYGKKRK